MVESKAIAKLLNICKNTETYCKVIAQRKQSCKIINCKA